MEARAAIPYFREQGSGVLINVASLAGKIGQPYTSAYTASKFAVVGLSECLRAELLDVEQDPRLHHLARLDRYSAVPASRQLHGAGRKAARADP